LVRDGSAASRDAAALGMFIAACYRDAGLAHDDVDSGAVILTGEAIKRRNAQAIDELFAAEAGKFVCATAGHKLESALAAHGAGAVKLSRERGACALLQPVRILRCSRFAAQALSIGLPQ
jgi:ethanolamine utilization protein EutA